MILVRVLPVREGLRASTSAGVSAILLEGATLNDFVETLRSMSQAIPATSATLTPMPPSDDGDQAIGWTRPSLWQTAIPLTMRERETMDLIADGLSNKEIAQRLHISVHTTKSHVHNLMGKLGSRSRLQIAARARSPREPLLSPASMPQTISGVTRREREISALIAEGLANRDIARRLHIAIHTVKSHVHSILKKLAVHTRVQIAIRQGWAPAPACALDLSACRPTVRAVR